MQRVTEFNIADKVIEDDAVLQTVCNRFADPAQYPQLNFGLFKPSMQAYPESFSDALNTEQEDQTAYFLSMELEESLTTLPES